MSLIERLQRRLSEPLPGRAAQLAMSPHPRSSSPSRRGRAREAAVLALLVPDRSSPSAWFLVLIRRAVDGSPHSGQVALPGGRRDPGESLRETALRESHEEIGVDASAILLIGELTPLYVPRSNYEVHPFVGFLPTYPRFGPNPTEVAKVIEASLTTLVTPETRRVSRVNDPNYGPRVVPYFDVEGENVWGATAMIVSELITMTAPILGAGGKV